VDIPFCTVKRYLIIAATRQDACSQRSTCVCSLAAGSLKLMHFSALKRQSNNQEPEAIPEAGSCSNQKSRKHLLREHGTCPSCEPEQLEPIKANGNIS
jgi:hypothetical protein